MAIDAYRRPGSRILTLAVQTGLAPVGDWNCLNEGFPNGMRILSITMSSTGIGDTVLIVDGPYNLSVLFGYAALRAGEQHTRYYGRDIKGFLCQPYIYDQLPSVGTYGIHFELA